MPCQGTFGDPIWLFVTPRDTVTGNSSTYPPFKGDQEKSPRIRKNSYGSMLASFGSSGRSDMTQEESIHRKLFHIGNGMIPIEIIHRKRLYIDHEKDPHLT